MTKTPKVFLDASVILAGLGSFKASSYALLNLGHQKIILLITSPTVIYEVKNRAYKVKKDIQDVDGLVLWANINITAIPNDKLIAKFASATSDPDDRHLFAACSQIKNVVLISLDRRHIISQRHKISYPAIFTPAEFLEKYYQEL